MKEDKAWKKTLKQTTDPNAIIIDANTFFKLQNIIDIDTDSDNDKTDEYAEETENNNNTNNNTLKQYKPTTNDDDKLHYHDGWSDDDKLYNDIKYHENNPPYQRNKTDRYDTTITDTELINKHRTKRTNETRDIQTKKKHYISFSESEQSETEIKKELENAKQFLLAEKKI